MANKDDYSTVFRNVRTDRTTGRYTPMRNNIPDPWWLAWVGGIVMGCVLALLLYWGVA